MCSTNGEEPEISPRGGMWPEDLCIRPGVACEHFGHASMWYLAGVFLFDVLVMYCKPP